MGILNTEASLPAITFKFRNSDSYVLRQYMTKETYTYKMLVFRKKNFYFRKTSTDNGNTWIQTNLVK